MSARSLPPTLSGRVIRSERQLGVYYELERAVDDSGMGRAYLARRKCEAGSAPIIVKVMHADVGGGAVAPELLAVKEAVALGRLNEQIPPCPFVVRLVDAGSAKLSGDSLTPWLAIEYVHGGAEGTTLEERVTYSLRRTGFGFDATRAGHFVRCVASGLDAIHAVSVIHRDLTPRNVLCCGFGEAEIFKISDFGVARPHGLERTFVGMKVGTPGYLAPEAHDPAAGPTVDVFSFACVIYYVLTGQRYFAAENPGAAAIEVAAPTRRSVMDHATLSPELFEQPAACRNIDAALARATHGIATARTRTAQALAQAVLPWFGGNTIAPRSSRRLLSAVVSAPPAAGLTYEFCVRSEPRDDLVIESAAFDSDGHALALAAEGAWFWDGQAWHDAGGLLAGVGVKPAFVRRHDAGGWLVGGYGPVLSVFDAAGAGTPLSAPAEDSHLVLASGRIADLLTVVEARPGAAPVLWCCSGGRWLKPFPLPGVAAISVLQRLDALRWVVAGRLQEGGGFAALYAPLSWEVTRLSIPPLRAFIGGASIPERTLAMLVGSEGSVLRLDGSHLSMSRIEHGPDLAAAGMDIVDCEWTTTLGQVFVRDAQGQQGFRPRWRNPGWRAPFISLMADVGQVVAMTADGAILEGRSDTR